MVEDIFHEIAELCHHGVVFEHGLYDHIFVLCIRMTYVLYTLLAHGGLHPWLALDYRRHGWRPRQLPMRCACEVHTARLIGIVEAKPRAYLYDCWNECWRRL